MPKIPLRDVDFKPREGLLRRQNARLPLNRLHMLALVVSGITGLALLLSGHEDAEALLESTAAVEMPLELPQSNDVLPSPSIKAAETDTPVAASELAPVAAQAGDWHDLTVKPGDSLAAMFSRVGLGPVTVHDVVNAGDAAKTLRKLFPKDKLRVLIDDAGKLQALRYPIDESVTLHIDRRDGGFESALVTVPLERRLAHAAASIDSSLFTAGKQAGLSDALVMELASIFGWDVDFALDIRAGDRFAVIYEELFREGEKVRTGSIVAAEFVNQGRTHRAVRYTDSNGRHNYYSADGRSMRKAFLRSPVDFRRISSGFNPNRLHPVLGTKRPHRGVDYAAAPGTPIRAAGDGKIVHLGTKGGYGRTVVIQHGERYSTLYAHMSRYGSGLRNGSRIRQGQIIGYVGSSGLATGPHLHYEFLVDGRHRNPITVSLPAAQPIARSLMEDFQQQTAPLVAQLDVIGRAQFADRAE